MKRRSRSLASVFAILALLFAQAMASVHACDAVNGAKPPAAASVDVAQDHDCCDHTTPPRDPACDNHCQQANQAPDRAQSTTVAPLATGVVMPGLALATSTLPQSVFSAPPDLGRDIQPPISIRNCCFRI